MTLQGSKIVILGGNGFIGSQLGQLLLSMNANVTSFDRILPENAINGIHYIQGDFFDDKQMLDAIAGAAFIVHAISTINPGNSSDNYMRGYEKDFVQSVKLFDAAARANQRVLFLSSGGTIYGKTNRGPVAESSSQAPINHYGSVKACIEMAMHTFIVEGAPFYIARIANPFGPGQDYRKGVGFIDAAIKHTLCNETIEVWGDGEVVRDYIYISDVCNMLCHLLTYEGNEHVFNIGSGIGATQNDIIDIIRQHFGDISVNYLPARAVDVPYIVLETSLYQSIFPYRCMSLHTGINKLIACLEKL